jgi:hypothetical protein
VTSLREQRGKLAEIGERTVQLSNLKKQPEWKTLREIMEGKRERYFAQLARELVHGRGEIDQRKLDFQRGFWAGVFYLLANPEAAEREFEKAAEKAERLKETADEG